MTNQREHEFSHTLTNVRDLRFLTAFEMTRERDIRPFSRLRHSRFGKRIRIQTIVWNAWNFLNEWNQTAQPSHIMLYPLQTGWKK
jgi:hypothetical protein